MIPQSYVYPAKMRATRDLLRRRNHLMRKHAELFVHIQNTRSQYNLPDHLGRIAKPQNREGVVKRFDYLSVQKMIATEFAVIAAYDPIIAKMERDIIRSAKHHDPVSHALLNTIPGLAEFYLWSYFMKSNLSSDFPECRISYHTAAWLKTLKSQTAKSTAQAVRK